MIALCVWLRRNRHLTLKEQHKMLSIKLRGHYQYYGVIGNIRKNLQDRLETCIFTRAELKVKSGSEIAPNAPLTLGISI